MRSVAAAILGLLVGGLALVMAGPSAYAYDPYLQPRPYTDMTQAEKQFRLGKFMEATKPSFHTTSSQAQAQLEAARRQGIATRAARSNFPGLSPKLVRGGLAGVAAGVWIHNGISLWNASQCGQTTCPPALELDTQFRQAETSTAGTSDNSTFRMYSSGTLVGSGIVTKVEYKFSSATSNCTVTMTYEMQNTSTTASTQVGMVQTSGAGAQCRYDGYIVPSNWSGNTVYNQFKSPYSYSAPESTNTSTKFRPYLVTQDSASGSPYSKQFGPTFTVRQNQTWESPVYDWGESALVPTAPTTGGRTPYAPTLPETDGFIEDIVADPEAPPKEDDPATEEDETLEPIEVVPDFFPSEWETEFPDINEPGPEDDPYSDPDEDGEPNHQDDDDDADGEPDEDDAQPFGVPVEWPSADPDDDGLPNEDDPDNDNDGIPDEDDPEPFIVTDPTTLPEEHPYADPDTDGEPNREDEDDDNDGIPDTADPQPTVPTDPATLPEDHPYADPDEDGAPNRVDEDDDGDGVPDTEDPFPHDPTRPETAPKGDPDEDGTPNDDDLDDDGDEVPDTIDPEPTNPAQPARWTATDSDLDGSPDTFDPLPEDETEPTGGPEGDGDGDGVPNRHDPAPTDSSRPSGEPSSDLDADGTPNVNDPDPYRKGEPSGGQSGDADGDGVTNGEDSAPNDPSVPAQPSSCESPREAVFVVPRLNIGSVFPFSLVVYAWNMMGGLVSEPVAPVVDLGFLGVMDMGAGVFGTIAQTARTAIWIVAGIGMCFVFYTWIRSGSS